MKTTITDKKRKILRTIYGALSFSTALFVFQACYGTPQDMGMDVLIQGLVKSKATSLPIPGIKVSIENQPQSEITDSNGSFKFYASSASEYKFKFEDIDSSVNGLFSTKDTILKVIDKSTFLSISLDAK
jgi:putative lipoprotein (rSAM/lipoprotein system)